MKLKKGDRVIMLGTSQYPEDSSNPRGVEGEVRQVFAKSYAVTWDNDEGNGGYLDTDIGLVPQAVNTGIQDSIDSLIFLEGVSAAYGEEQEGWFRSLSTLLSGTLHSEWPKFFDEYESTYKEKTSSTSMPTTYRTAKSVISNGYSSGVSDWDTMSKSRLEKATKERRRAKTSAPTPEELLGTIISAVQTINSSFNQLNPSSKAYTEAESYLSAELEYPYE